MILKKSCLKILIVFILSTLSLSSYSTEQNVYPDTKWSKAKKPEDLGYSSEKLAKAKEFADGLKTAAVMIIVNGQVLYEWGETGKKYYVHSARKSFLSALYGKYVKNGTIDLNMTMADLGIDDAPPLTEQEKTTTIRNCLKGRSGVYHTAEAETEGMHKMKPARDSLMPGTYFIYNNWDFNVAGTIFKNLTGKGIFEALKEDIADPILMEDFAVKDCNSYKTGRSVHEAYMFALTARDMARFGLLMLRNGKWKDKQIIPEKWVKESTAYYSDAALFNRDGFGYMWWVAKDNNNFPHLKNVDLKEGTYSARGYGGHCLYVIPEYDMVFVHRTDTFVSGNNVSEEDIGKILNLIFEAKLK